MTHKSKIWKYMTMTNVTPTDVTPTSVTLLSLAPELVCQILAAACASYRDAIEIMVTCKSVKAFFDPRSNYGERLWSCVRAGELLPDGKALGFDDYTVLRRFFGRGCDMCTHHPQVRTVYWAFEGRRMCSACLKVNTCTLSDLWAAALPSGSLLSFRAFIREWDARWHSGSPFGRSSVLFWRPDVLTVKNALKLHGEEMARLRLRPVVPSREAIGNFTKDVRQAKDKRSRLHIETIETARAARKAALDASIQKWTDMPLIAPVLEMMWAYQGEVWKTKPFTSRREKAFRREIEKEMGSRKKWLAMAQLKSVAETRHGRKLVGSPEWKQFRDSEKQAISDRDIPTVAEAEVIVDRVEALRLQRVSTIERWKAEFVDILPDGMAKRCILSSPLFLRGRREDEPIFRELIHLYTRPVRELPETSAALPEGVSIQSSGLFCANCGHGRRHRVDFHNFREHVLSSRRCSLEHCRVQTRRMSTRCSNLID